MTLSVLGAKAAAILSILGVLGLGAAYSTSWLAGYVQTDEFYKHISEFSRLERSGYEDKVLDTENDIEILNAEPVLTTREKIKLKQLNNKRERFLRRLKEMQPKS